MDETGRVAFEQVVELRELIMEMPDDMTFSQWLTAMEALQKVAYGADYDSFDPETRADSIRMNFMAIVHELVEMTTEMGWKPWSSPQGWVHEGPAIKEGVDAMHFMANLFSHTRVTGEELGKAYKAKMLINLDRQIAGYNVEVEKCADCGRDIREAVEEQIRTTGRRENNELQYGDTVLKFCSMPHRHRYFAK